MANRRLSGFSVFLMVMILLALLGAALMIFGSMTYKPAPSVSPWTVAGCIRNG